MRDLDGRVAIVTGASQGLGRAIAMELARAGTRTILWSRSLERARGLAEEITSRGGRAEPVACDLGDETAVTDAVARIVEAHETIDVLVNNAGVIAPIGPIADTTAQEWAMTMMVNVVGPYHATKAVLPLFCRLGSGTIVNVSSGAADKPREGWSAYCASKAALAMFTQSISLEYRQQGVHAYGVRPGLVDTGMQAAIRDSGINEISRVPREELTPPQTPAMLITRLCAELPEDLVGQEVSVRDAEVMSRFGLGELYVR